MSPQLDAMPTSAKDNKKQRRKEVTAELARHEAALKQLVRAAEADADPLRSFAPFVAYSRNGLDACIRAFTGEGLPAPLAAWALALCRGNMQEMYEAVWGWSDKKKQRQLEDESSRFLVAFEAAAAAPAPAEAAEGAGEAQAAGGAEGQPLAYLNYRFEVEDGVPVAYCYEVQLEERAQRKGLGKHLMRLLELMALRNGMAGVLLTVMRANTDAIAFYARLGYSEHESSPGYADPDEEPAGYVILCKPLSRPARGHSHAHGHGHAHGHAGCCGC
ncbi:hypothetical protein Rsub_12032 [Raphidocelis subcapitata]|uniref:N-alpha-acetyltransferase 40 n=1 Tax=Raphidocelis subcapitata TaxID=307507 RepID=A0A2V0PJT2_9CHLO|nr:hypothetical protein Rsub_12032 [Raphidocelis subcapitata]|eukprot:GBF99272.1 hypothetical protein Rsub_12032 [Raphidocelis subcapitata]